MKTRLLSINSFYKYKKIIDDKNIWGIWWNFTVFEALWLLSLVTKAIANPESVNIVHLIFAIMGIGGVIGWLRCRVKHREVNDLTIIATYVLVYAYIGYSEIHYGGTVVFVIFALISLDLALSYLINPIHLSMGQVEGAIAYLICFRIKEGYMSFPVFSRIVVVTLFCCSMGILVWYARITTLAFENEVLYLSTGSDDEFITHRSRKIWDEYFEHGVTAGIDGKKRKTFTFVVNMTTDKLISVRDNNIFELKNEMDWNEVVCRILRFAGDPQTYRGIERILDRNTLISDYTEGKEKKSVVGCFNLPNGRMWMNLSISLRPHPINGQVMNIVVIEDITSDKIYMGVMNRMIGQNYDAVMVVERGRQSGIMFMSREGEDILVKTFEDYENMMVGYVTEWIADYDREKALKCGHLKSLYEELKDKDVFEIYIDEFSPTGHGRKKHFQASFLDSDKRFLVVQKQDVTDILNKEREAQEIFENNLKEVQRANATKTEFLSKMSHEMRTPMNAIVGLSELIEDVGDDKELLRDYVSKIKESSDYLLQIITDILDMSGISSGEMEMKYGEYTYGELIEGINSKILPLCAKKNIDYKVNHEIPDNTRFKVDKPRFTQLFYNILSNSAKYTSDGGNIEFDCYCIGRESDNGFFRFVVKDNGIGMSEEFIEHLFEPFSQEDSTNKQSLNGTGLGLSISKGIVDLFGGKISATSKVGVGTTVVIDLCLETLSDEFAAKKADKLNIEDLAGRRVLVVEDNEINREIVVAVLGKKKIIADEVVNGAEAVERFANSGERYYDAILMDIRMPKMNGLEATRKIRNLARRDAAHIPIIAMTANAFNTDAELSTDSGMNAHLSKPIDPQLLYNTLLEHIE